VVQAAVALAVQLTALTELQILAAVAVVLVAISAIQQVLAGQVLSLFVRSSAVVQRV
jgi:NADH:ubiquinone oxidoreductase subunit K